jgi:hypothetical protein
MGKGFNNLYYPAKSIGVINNQIWNLKDVNNWWAPVSMTHYVHYNIPSHLHEPNRNRDEKKIWKCKKLCHLSFSTYICDNIWNVKKWIIHYYKHLYYFFWAVSMFDNMFQQPWPSSGNTILQGICGGNEQYKVI